MRASASCARQVETARKLDVMELRSEEGALQSQLSGETEDHARCRRAPGIYRAQLAELQSAARQAAADLHRPVSRRGPRAATRSRDLRKQTAQRRQRGSSRGRPARRRRSTDPRSSTRCTANCAASSPTRAAADRRRRIAHGRDRSRCSTQELDRSRRIAASESALAELTRDYEVNRDIYQDLLKRRENARVSMNLDAEAARPDASASRIRRPCRCVRPACA